MIKNDLYDDDSTNNEQLDYIGKKLMHSNYVGTYSGDIIPRLKHDQCCILNTKNQDHGGEHWCGLYKYHNDTWFFDAFNRPYSTLNHLWKSYKWTQPSIMKLEADPSSDCGQTSIAALYTMYKYDPQSFYQTVKP